MSNRRVQLRVAYSSVFAQQSGFGVALAMGAIDRVFTLKEGGQSHIEPISKTEEVQDCTTQYLLDIIMLHRTARLTLDLEVDTDTLYGLFGWAAGVIAGDSTTMLAPQDFILPATTLVIGFDDNDDPGMILKDAVVASIEITGRVEQKLGVKVVFVGHGELPDAVGFTFPECVTITPLRFDANTQMIVNGVERIDDTRGITLTFDNAPPMTDFPFGLGSVDITRQLERADKRPLKLDWIVVGRPNDPTGVAVRAQVATHYPFIFRIGSGTDGVEFEAGDSLFQPSGTALQGWDGEVSLAVLNTMLTPVRVPGDNQTPLLITKN